MELLGLYLGILGMGLFPKRGKNLAIGNENSMSYLI